jgi:hypothetical protein
MTAFTQFPVYRYHAFVLFLGHVAADLFPAFLELFDFTLRDNGYS